jgi:hypothetical protein
LTLFCHDFFSKILHCILNRPISNKFILLLIYWMHFALQKISLAVHLHTTYSMFYRQVNLFLHCICTAQPGASGVRGKRGSERDLAFPVQKGLKVGGNLCPERANIDTLGIGQNGPKISPAKASNPDKARVFKSSSWIYSNPRPKRVVGR